ncbi:MAG: hypothetical protein WBP12_02590 [Candidatus Saccharimonas sp.]
MRNLAGVANADTFIEYELTHAGIDIVDATAKEAKHSEVPFTVAGQLGRFRFLRAWTYWVVRGSVPQFVAELLYADPVGRTAVRVNGDCTCPAPAGGDLVLRLPDGREVIDAASRGSSWIKHFETSTYVFSDDPLAASAIGYVTSYHIDSQDGLDLFARVMREHCMPAILA